MSPQDHTAPYSAEVVYVLLDAWLRRERAHACSCGYFLDDEEVDHGEC